MTIGILMHTCKGDRKDCPKIAVLKSTYSRHMEEENRKEITQ
jgi:hypothetical protein